MLELSNVGRSETQAARLGFRVFSEGFFKAKFALVLALFLHRIDQQQVCAASSENPTTISANIEAYNRLTKSGNMSFGIDTETVKHANIAFIASNCNVTFFGRCGG
jgi:hypothetical protein